ncbi:casein kinase 1-like protein [Anaeramoeba flamelloides]|uniref:non-specific serine/threonine protein kinase n=1 Tax=Anaeramoeba flamelloides TaxID=1746091 RepID=A0AAV7YCR6_9EUKA|nr:casein kinase 1-like protein [Anaeramoeba flamelloides]
MGNQKSTNLPFSSFIDSDLPTIEQLAKQSLLVNGKYKIKEKIGYGSFGKIYHCIRLSDNIVFAVKFETEKQEGQLEYENKLYCVLKDHVGVPDVYHFGVHNYDHYMIMDLLGPNLESLFNYCDRKFSLKTVLMIADQILCRIQLLHTKCFVYRDIKPENFVIGKKNQKNQIFLIDFGLAKLYRDFWTKKFNNFRNNRDLVGTVRYSSINTHLGIEQSRRDDLESIGYLLVYFLKGRLPWQGFKVANNRERNQKISDKKVNTPLRVLCEGIPVEFIEYLDYCKNLNFDETPNYTYLKRKFRALFLKKGYVYDYKYDWKIKHDKKIELKKRKYSTINKSKNNEEECLIVNSNLETTKGKYENEKTSSQKNEIGSHQEEHGEHSFSSDFSISPNENKKNLKKVMDKKKKEERRRKKKEKQSKNENKDENEKEKENGERNEKNEERNEKNEINETELDPNLENKIKDFRTRIKYIEKKANKKLKLKIENMLLKKQILEKELNEKQQKLETTYFLRKNKIFSLKCKQIYENISEIEEILQQNPKYQDFKIEEILSSIKMKLKTHLNFNQVKILQNDLNNLLFLISEKKSSLEKESWKKDEKKMFIKNYQEDRIVKYNQLIEKKINLITEFLKKREFKDEIKIHKQFEKLKSQTNKNLNLKQCGKISNNLDKMITMIKEKFVKK